MISRRTFVKSAAATAGALALPAWPARASGLPDGTLALLDKSGFVYVSPLKSDGAESQCHGEVWYSWIDGAVVLVTAADSWKARSLAAGRDQARIWVGDHGRAKGALGSNEEFRKAPSFDARVAASKDGELLDRLMQSYRAKYPDGIDRWEPRFRTGFASGERLLLRYVPS